jgi:hypothetical protein
VPLRGAFRPSLPAPALMALAARRRGLRAFDYSAITDCSMLTDFQRSQDPACGGAPPVATYTAPTNLQTPSNCIDPASGLPFFTPDCVNANLAIEAANQAKDDAANRTVFVQDCNNAWALNKTQYEALGLPVPPNDCAYRTYGQTLPGTTGGTTAYLPGTPQAVIDWRTADPSGGVMNAWDPSSAQTLATFHAPPAPSGSPSPAPGPTTAPTAGAPAPRATAPSGGSAPAGALTTGGGAATGEWYKKPVVLIGGAALVAFLIWKANQ